MADVKQSDPKTTTDKVAITIVVIVVIGILAFLISAMNSAKDVFKDKPSDNNSTSQGAKKDDSNFNVAVEQNAFGIQITNNEKYELSDCKVEVNYAAFSSGWETHESFAAGETKVLPWSSFQKGDGEKFDHDTHAVKNVMINLCKDQGSRFASFETTN